MYAITATSGIMNYELNNIEEIFSQIAESFKKSLSGIYRHSGRTDASGGHKDNENKSRLGSYHYHHGVSAHLHPNGICPYGNKETFIINPYTGKKISLGQPYLLPYYEENLLNIEYYSLNLVSKALTMHDNMGVELGLNNTGGLFRACSTGDSSMTKLGEEFTFSYPTFLTIKKDNTFFETNKGNLQLLCHTQKVSSDDTPCYAYICMETVGDYMTKHGYFTDFTDNGSSVWRFAVRKPIVKNIKITSSNNSNAPFNVGDTLTIEAEIENVANAKLIIGKYNEDKVVLLDQGIVKFSDYIITKEDLGILTVNVEVNTGGTAVVVKTVTSAVQIQVVDKSKQYVSIDQLKNILTATGHFQANAITESMVDDLNKVLQEYSITTEQQIRFLLAVCAHETRLALTEAGYLSEEAAREYCERYEPGTQSGENLGNTEVGDGYKFRGAGYIQLTGRYNYQDFSDYISEKYGSDFNIMEKGASHVAISYPWEVAGYYWNKYNINDVIKNGNATNQDTIKTFKQVSNAVNWGDAYSELNPIEWDERLERLDEVTSVY